MANATGRQRPARDPEPGGSFAELKAFGAPDFREVRATPRRLLATGQTSSDREKLLNELRFLDDRLDCDTCQHSVDVAVVAQAWQQRVLDEELDGLAKTVIDPQPGQDARLEPDDFPNLGREGAAASSRDAKYALLDEDPVARRNIH